MEKRGNSILMTGGYRRSTRLETIEEKDEDETEISLASQFKMSIAQIGVEQWTAQMVYMTESIDGILKGL